VELRKAVGIKPKLLPYAHDPELYVREYRKGILTPKQSEVCQKMMTYPFRVLMPSANNMGKTYCLAQLANWMYDCHNPSETICTAVTGTQIRNGVFKEIRKIRGYDNNFLPSASELRESPTHIIRGLSTKNPDAFQGTHSAKMMMLFDEATGIHQDIFKRGLTMHQMEPGHYWLAAYNPNDSSSYVATIEDDSDWHVVRFNALEHPNIIAELQGLPPPIPAAVRLVVVYERMKKECRLVDLHLVDPDIDFNFPVGSNYWWKPLTIEFEAQVLGRWPLTPTQSLLSMSQLGYLGEYVAAWDDNKQLSISADIARFGDDKTCILVRRGLVIAHIELWEHRNGEFVAQRINELILQYKLDTEKISNIPIYIDGTGGYGGSVQDFLPFHKVYAISMSEKSPSDAYKRMRSFLWFQLYEILLKRCLDFSMVDRTILHELKQDLTAPRYRIDETGKKYLEPKTQTKSRRGQSPDIGDTLALSMYELIAA
jgi:hypothetical protein